MNRVLGMLVLVAGFGYLSACGTSPESKTASEAPPPPKSSKAVPGAYPAAVDAQRLIDANAEPGQWMSYNRTYAEERFSPLDQIHTGNVDQLGLAWHADLTTSRGQESTPVVVDGALYVTMAWSLVRAYDVETGELLWEYDPKVDRSKGVDACCDVVNRGVAVWDGKVYVGVLDGRLVALDSSTGDVVWEKMTVDTSKPYTITGAPRIIKGQVIIGNGGAELGVRGYVTAYDADTGEKQWRFYTVPGNPEEGFEHPDLKEIVDTWNGQWWKQGGGGTVWDAMAYDPELDLLYLGVGNGSPWNQAIRSPGGGDNLYLSSIVAIDPDDGSYVWHYQTTPGETWDYTASQHLILADLTIDGEERRVIMQAPKNGFFYVVDAKTGELISAEKFVPINWATHVDMETGRPQQVRAARYDKTGEPYVVYPGPQGAHNWHPMAYNPETQLVYIPTRQQATGYVSDPDFEASIRGWNTGIDFAKGAAMMRDNDQEGLPEPKSYLLAWDPVEQKEVWRAPQPDPRSTAGVLTTGGDLVFMGNAAGEFVAYHARTGQELWSSVTQARVVASPSSYTVDGEQYVAVVVGGRGLPSKGPGAVGSTTDQSTNNSRLLVYKLGGNARLPGSGDAESAPKPDASSEPAPPPITASNEVLAHGEQVYGRFCSVCHGPNAISPDPGTFPDLRRSGRIRSAEEWANVVLEGELAEKGMVSFASDISEEDAEAIRHYVIAEANRDM